MSRRGAHETARKGDGVNTVKGIALDPDSEGKAPMVGVRLLPGDAVRLRRLASRRRLSRSALTRELLRYALDQIERAGEPPGEASG